MAWLYTYRDGALTVYKGKFEEESIRRDHKLVFTTLTGNKRMIVDANEGVVCHDQLWLYVQNDLKAVEKLIESKNEKILKLQRDINKLNDQIFDLYSLRAAKYEVRRG